MKKREIFAEMHKKCGNENNKKCWCVINKCVMVIVVGFAYSEKLMRMKVRMRRKTVVKMTVWLYRIYIKRKELQESEQAKCLFYV